MKKPLQRFNKPSSIEDVMDCEVVLNVSESYGVTIQVEPLSLYFHAELSIFSILRMKSGNFVQFWE